MIPSPALGTCGGSGGFFIPTQNAVSGPLGGASPGRAAGRAAKGVAVHRLHGPQKHQQIRPLLLRGVQVRRAGNLNGTSSGPSGGTGSPP